MRPFHSFSRCRLGLRVSVLVALVMFPALAGASHAVSTAQSPSRNGGHSWMSEAAMRADFAGQTLDGHYGSGTTWTETYFADGRIDYRESNRVAKGRWHFRGGVVFCTFYDPPYSPAFVGGCWQVIKTGANCYEFYTAGTQLPGSRREKWRISSALRVDFLVIARSAATKQSRC